MNTKIYVGNLPEAFTESDVMNLFSTYGNVVDVNVAVDPSSRKALGFGFVTMVTTEGARAAIHALNGKGIGSSRLTVSEECPQEDFAKLSSSRRKTRRSSSSLF